MVTVNNKNFDKSTLYHPDHSVQVRGVSYAEESVHLNLVN